MNNQLKLMAAVLCAGAMSDRCIEVPTTGQAPQRIPPSWSMPKADRDALNLASDEERKRKKQQRQAKKRGRK